MSTTTDKEPSDFYAKTRTARRVMVLDLGFLGDTIHLIPALAAVRAAYPQAELHTMVADHIKGVLDLAPWIDRVWGYPRFPKGPKPWQDVARVKALRAARFDVVINLNGSDRSSWLTWLSGAPVRLGRVPEDGGPWAWRWFYTHAVTEPFKQSPVYVQRWNCLKKAGVPGERPEFNAQLNPAWLAATGIGAEEKERYAHLSPCTNEDRKELPLERLVELVAAIRRLEPDLKLAVSCSPNDRERGKLDALLERLPEPPWKVFRGTLSLQQLAAVIGNSAVHLGGDSGALHLALVTGARSVSWFRNYPHLLDWKPIGPRHRTLIGEETPHGLRGIAPQDLADGVQAVLRA